MADGVVYLLFPHGIGHLLGLDVHDMEDLGDRAGYLPGRTAPRSSASATCAWTATWRPGMAVTIEPGIYIVPPSWTTPSWPSAPRGRLDRGRLDQFSDVRGIRIEDDVLVTAAGHEVLTAEIPKTRAAIEEASNVPER